MAILQRPLLIWQYYRYLFKLLMLQYYRDLYYYGNILQVQDALDILKPDQVLKVGGAGHKVLLLMEGQASAYVFPSPGNIIITPQLGFKRHLSSVYKLFPNMCVGCAEQSWQTC